MVFVGIFVDSPTYLPKGIWDPTTLHKLKIKPFEQSFACDLEDFARWIREIWMSLRDFGEFMMCNGHTQLSMSEGTKRLTYHEGLTEGWYFVIVVPNCKKKNQWPLKGPSAPRAMYHWVPLRFKFIGFSELVIFGWWRSYSKTSPFAPILLRSLCLFMNRGVGDMSWPLRDHHCFLS